MVEMVTIVLWVALSVVAPLALIIHSAIRDRPWRCTVWLSVYILAAFAGVAPSYGILHGLLLLFAWGCWRLAEGSPRVIIAIALVLTALVYAGPLRRSLSLVQTGYRLQAEHPLVSISDRLAYETSVPKLVEEPPQMTVPLSREVEAELAQMEDESRGGSSRTRVLEQIHNATFYRFVIANGFGVSRMSSYPRNNFREPISPPIPIQSTTPPEYDPDNPPWDDPVTLQDGPADGQGWGNEMHRDGIKNFLNPERMGYFRSREEVAGFLPHGFHRRFSPMHQLETTSVWRINRLELVSLLKHETPVAYLSDHLPQMEQLADAETRPLNEFEQAALAQLRTEEDLITDEGENHIRMLGAIRAARSCLECHSVRRGELLGAFSYELRRPGRVGE